MESLQRHRQFGLMRMRCQMGIGCSGLTALRGDSQVNTAKTLPAAVLALTLYCAPLSAGYVLDGNVDASVCTSYFFFSACRMVQVDAVKSDDGRIFTATEEFDSAIEYDERNRRCFIRLQDSSSWFSWAVRKTFGQTFLTKNPDGGFDKIDPEYITFKCRKQD